MPRDALTIAGTRIAPGTTATVSLPVPETYLRQGSGMPVHVFHGKKEGPSLLVCAAIHGDELNGIEVVRRLVGLRRLTTLSGTLFAVPVVNIYGFMSNTRYLPDRRDLNRYFPGREGGSLASELAQTLFDNVVSQCDFGIDLHTGSNFRTNLPHLRGDMADPEIMAMAKAFGVPLSLDVAGAEGSLRYAAQAIGVKMLLCEAGEALRFDELSIRAGVKGVTAVMEHLGMLRPRKVPGRKRIAMQVAKSRTWARATASGIFQTKIQLGQLVEEGERLGKIYSPFTDQNFDLLSPKHGVVIGIQTLPSVYKGDAIMHIASFETPVKAEAVVEEFSERIMEGYSMS